MSMFGSLLGDFEDDPFFGSHMRSMRQMNDMMNSMFSNPFGMFGGMGPPAIGPTHVPAIGPTHVPAIGPTHVPAIGPSHGPDRGRADLMPFGFPNMNNMNRMFEDIDRLGNPNCHSFSSSTMMTMTSGPDGRPQVYQASSSTRTAPGGVKETKKSVSDSQSGVKKISIGHHIGERAHVLEREQNYRSGDQEERQELINLEEEEAEDFNKEFEQRTRQSLGAIGYSSNSSNRHAKRHREPQLALPSSSSSRHRSRSYLSSSHDRRSHHRSSPVSISPAESTTTTSTVTPPPPPPQQQQQQHERARKRDHEPDVERKHKALKPSQQSSDNTNM